MKNKLTDLNNHLFTQLERLCNEDLTPEQLKQEVARSKAIATIAAHTIANARLVFDAQVEFGGENSMPDMLALEQK